MAESEAYSARFFVVNLCVLWACGHTGLVYFVIQNITPSDPL